MIFTLNLSLAEASAAATETLISSVKSVFEQLSTEDPTKVIYPWFDDNLCPSPPISCIANDVPPNWHIAATFLMGQSMPRRQLYVHDGLDWTYQSNG